jgi:hypothetical protein
MITPRLSRLARKGHAAGRYRKQLPGALFDDLDSLAQASEVGALPSSLHEHQHELAKALLAESREELTRADGKASILLAALGIGLSAILAAILSGDWSPFGLHEPYQAVWWAGSACAGVALVSLGLAIYPRVKHNTRSSGVTYYGDVARLENADALRAALKRSQSDPVARTLIQLFVVAKLVYRKVPLHPRRPRHARVPDRADACRRACRATRLTPSYGGANGQLLAVEAHDPP